MQRRSGKTVRNLGLAGLVFLSVAAMSCERPRTITVETDPPGGIVFSDGRSLGTAPVSIDRSKLGTSLRVEMSGPGSPVAKPTGRGPLIKLNTAYLPITAYLPLFVAMDKGYFSRTGVQVNAIEATTPNDIITAMAAGKVDFAAALAYTILFPSENQYPGLFKLFSTSEETAHQYTSSVIVRSDSPLKSYQDLRRKKIGVYTGVVQVLFLKAMLNGMGIPPGEVQIIEISPRLQIQGLLSGQYDALSSTEPTTNIAVIEGMAKALVENPRVKYIMKPFPSTAAAIAKALIERDPAAAKAVSSALDMAIDFIRSHPDEAKRILPKYTPIPKQYEERVLADLKLFRFCKLGEENRLNVQRFADYLFNSGLIKKRIEDVNRLFADQDEAFSR